MVQWDHRGAGKTLRRNGKAGSGEMTFDRRVDDAVELIEFLPQHLGVDKVIVLAESMGTLTGLPLAKRRPDPVHALAATDLYLNMAANEATKYQLTLERLPGGGTPRASPPSRRSGPTRPGGTCRPGTPTWRGRSRPTCPRPTWTAGCCSPRPDLPDLQPAGPFQPVRWVPVVHRADVEEFTAYDAWRLGIRLKSRSSCSRARAM
jgi:pimeloyl-ACP methyl ester carboxylesterase